MTRRRAFRLLSAALGAGLAFLLLEAGVRLRYPTLPSLAGLDGWAWRPTGCREGAVMVAPQSVQGTQDGVQDGVQDGAPGARLGIFGDSIAAGVRLRQPSAQRFGALLAAALSTPERPWRERNEAHPGSGWCPGVTTAAARIQERRVDIAVLELFADDLSVHAQIDNGGRLIRFPAQASAWTRPLVEASWLLNLLWLGWGGRYGSPDHRYIHPEDQALFVRSVQDLSSAAADAQIPLVILLLPPIGTERCLLDTPPGSACEWMLEDLAMLAGLLDASRVPWLDLRWIYGLDRLQVPEEDGQPPGALAVHPDPEGHRRIAARVLDRLKETGAAPSGAAIPEAPPDTPGSPGAAGDQGSPPPPGRP